MKKIISILLAVILVIACTTTVNAMEFYGYDNTVRNNQNEETGSITIESRIYSHYTIELPEVIDTSDVNGGMVRVINASLEDNFCIKVGITNLNENGRVTMQHKTKDGITADLYINGNYSSMPSDPDKSTILKFTGDGEEYISCQIDSSAPAGDYEGIVIYSISCVQDN